VVEAVEQNLPLLLQAIKKVSIMSVGQEAEKQVFPGVHAIEQWVCGIGCQCFNIHWVPHMLYIPTLFNDMCNLSCCQLSPVNHHDWDGLGGPANLCCADDRLLCHEVPLMSTSGQRDLGQKHLSTVGPTSLT
jgi:hypothetical protein